MELLLFVVDTTRLLVAALLFLNKQSVASQNTNKLAGLVEGDGAGRARFWACMHMFMREGLVSGDVGAHHRDESWNGMADEIRKLQVSEWVSG